MLYLLYHNYHPPVMMSSLYCSQTSRYNPSIHCFCRHKQANHKQNFGLVQSFVKGDVSKSELLNRLSSEPQERSAFFTKHVRSLFWYLILQSHHTPIKPCYNLKHTFHNSSPGRNIEVNLLLLRHYWAITAIINVCNINLRQVYLSINTFSSALSES